MNLFFIPNKLVSLILFILLLNCAHAFSYEEYTIRDLDSCITQDLISACDESILYIGDEGQIHLNTNRLISGESGIMLITDTGMFVRIPSVYSNARGVFTKLSTSNTCNIS